MRELLGGKGANLAEMTTLGMPVPQGFTVTTEACTQYYLDGEVINDDIQAEIMTYITELEKIAGKKIRRFGKSSAGFCSFRLKGIYAWYDGYDPQPWIE